ncbi:hypothetical protein DPMN_117497 [Dreissena polymorpha]|uniref:Uncharacterized protein n=1 Tax=Dreissena polymorpha TaxID=45954 RepID=A0A9D4QV92_DREPO|nr:hypothetical protein DPMN_117497 [Dreissena polymorpha]
MLKSVTNFASSVSRNMDRLSLDGGHIRRQEESRRHRPDGVSEGLKQGLTGLGISVLETLKGAQIRACIVIASSSSALGNDRQTDRLADHPIQSLLSSGQDDQEGEGHQGSTATATGLVTGMGKGLVGSLCHRQAKTLPSSDILCCVEAGHVDLTEREVPVTLVLTPEILFVVCTVKTHS